MFEAKFSDENMDYKSYTLTNHVENELKLFLPKINQLKSVQKVNLFLQKGALSKGSRFFSETSPEYAYTYGKMTHCSSNVRSIEYIHDHVT